MTLWLLIFGVVAGAALLCEVIAHLAPELFATNSREAALKEEISKLHHDLTTADKKIASMKTSTRASDAEIEAARLEINRIDREITQKKRVPPNLIYRIGPPSPTQLRYRAPITKQLPEQAEAHQTLVWRTPCAVETWAHTPRQAAQQAHQQFRPELGYSLGAFVRRDEPA
jgi:septal ring factor EnvC (AmiA/AmiB activator)